jgi:hypothetical protein
MDFCLIALVGPVRRLKTRPTSMRGLLWATQRAPGPGTCTHPEPSPPRRLHRDELRHLTRARACEGRAGAERPESVGFSKVAYEHTGCLCEYNTSVLLSPARSLSHHFPPLRRKKKVRKTMTPQRLRQREDGRGYDQESVRERTGSSGGLVEPFFEHLRPWGGPQSPAHCGPQSPAHCGQTHSLHLRTRSSCAYASAGKMRTVFLCKRRFGCAVGAASIPFGATGGCWRAGRSWMLSRGPTQEAATFMHCGRALDRRGYGG